MALLACKLSVARIYGAIDRHEALESALAALLGAVAGKLDHPPVDITGACATLRVAAHKTAQRLMHVDMENACAALGASVAPARLSEEAFAWARSPTGASAA